MPGRSTCPEGFDRRFVALFATLTAMALWHYVLLAAVSVITGAGITFVIWLRRAALTPAEAAAELRAFGVELARLPGRLRRVAADPRTPRRARWWLIGLAVYVASPIDPIPDFLPGIGHLDEVILVPIVLRHIRAMIPDEVWDEHFSRRAPETPGPPPEAR
jgi:uncharacterized membrane protein YkvA (DUF1232 family)